MSIHYGPCQGGIPYVSRLFTEPVYRHTGRVYFCPCWVDLMTEWRDSILEWKTEGP